MRFQIANDWEDQDKIMAEDLGTPPPFRRETYEEFLRSQAPPPQQHSQHTQINTNTYMSIGIFIALFTGVVWITNTINRFDSKIDTLAAQLKDVQNVHESWSYHDMFKWCVHLQRDNPQIKIPEPEAPK